jgi:NitT/TauT family transport system substrate-binding protein
MASSENSWWKRIGRGAVAAITCLLVVGVLGACGDDDSDSGGSEGGGGSPSTEEVTLQLGWIEKEEYAFLYSGIENGFFEEQGIDLKIQTGDGSSVAMTTVSEGRAEFGYTGGPSFFVARSEGLPLKMVAMFLQQSPSVILSWPETPVDDLKDLEGQRFILTPGDGFTALWPACAERNDVDQSKVEGQSIGTEARAQAFVAHRSDAMPWFVTTSVAELEEQAGTTFESLSAVDFDCSILQNGLFTTDELIDSDPDLVKRMVAASTKSWDWTEKNPEKAAEVILERLPDYELEDVTQVVEATNELAHTEASAGKPTGWMAESDWQDSLELMEQSDQLSEPLEIDDLYTNEFIPGAGK